MAKTQGEVVVIAVRAVFPTGKVPSTTEWAKEQLTEVHEMVVQAFLSGEVEKRSGGSDEAAIRKYVPGLVNNWVRKSKELNGGEVYIPKNPGSRSGSGDEKLRNLKVLLTLVTDPEARVAVQQEIDKRVAELQPKVEINVDLLPESLRHLLKK